MRRQPPQAVTGHKQPYSEVTGSGRSMALSADSVDQA